MRPLVVAMLWHAASSMPIVTKSLLEEMSNRMSSIENRMHMKPKFQPSHPSQLQLAIVNGKEFNFQEEMNKHLGLSSGSQDASLSMKLDSVSAAPKVAIDPVSMEGEWSEGVMKDIVSDFNQRMARLEQGMPPEKGYEKENRKEKENKESEGKEKGPMKEKEGESNEKGAALEKEKKPDENEEKQPKKEENAELRESNVASETLVAGSAVDEGERPRNVALKQQHQEDWIKKVNADAEELQKAQQKKEQKEKALENKDDEGGPIFKEFVKDLKARLQKVEQEFGAASGEETKEGVDAKKKKDPDMPDGNPKPDGVPPSNSPSKLPAEPKSSSQQEAKSQQEGNPTEKWAKLKTKSKSALDSPQAKQQRAKLQVAKDRAQLLNAKATKTSAVGDSNVSPISSSVPEIDLLKQKTNELVAFGEKITSDFKEDKRLDVSNSNAWFAGEMA